MNEDSAHRINRSVSAQISPASLNKYAPKITRPTPEIPKYQCCNLLSVSLWESITGEKTTPARISQIIDTFLPQPPGTVVGSPFYSQQSSQYVKMAKDRQDCIMLQEQIDHATPAERDTIFNVLYPHMGDLVCDGAANFLIQKLCEYLNEEQQTRMLAFFMEDVQRIVDHPNGCRVLQKFIESTTSPSNIDPIFLALLPRFVELCSSQNGNHIAQRFIIKIPQRVPDIINKIKTHVYDLVVDNWGCRVIQQLFDRLPIQELIPLVDEVLCRAETLATNQFGNYVVQNILNSGTPEHIQALIDAFTGHFYEFSMHKFASNVIEKCIRKANPQQQNMIFTEIIGPEGNYNRPRIKEMVSDQFGNYVIQRIIEFGTESQQNIIYLVTYDNYNFLFKCSYAKHVISCLTNLGYEF
ncbi:Pumilio-family RNA binding repeat containing protein [Trichomonas vaginalis G3]|uniref:Pumilio-family RNA binding repeat containing protein n=1 Tax=Trichomonas vaginalis (strain ATCC PRA-98 / G3) TaxID=412133 RepID=A2EWR3_TRIV3|nr:mRNA binding [Trichomonas vaginalis G3]EAY02893.1 Pumilio-family RNA binding repeat containing protein [Trichomonas vaginalis G3]KAI5551258.1 mRNA binding [Trichomonas vaginalis G3]|eukprot:XP_001315116.1 Pumilio-family RNA binding repeat containing protein [Trichomonas vaginalis G3]